jgi:site-specific recombinase XerD
MIQRLDEAINDYLLWMISSGYSENMVRQVERILGYFSTFVREEQIRWEDIFTHTTLTAFKHECEPLIKERKLPELYEEYLCYYGCKVLYSQVQYARKILSALLDYLQEHSLVLSNIKISDLDAFMAHYNARYTYRVRQAHRSYLRGFLRYLYYERRILRKDFASLLGGPPEYAHTTPPKFLRPHEIQRLFTSITPSSARELRAYAMLHLAYTLGLRPREISLIKLDDISFSRGEIGLPDRKNTKPLTLPLSDDAIKSIAAYIVGGRQKSNQRTLFLSLCAPYGPISPSVVTKDIRICMQKAHLPSSAYWLRHTYAQTLLQRGASIYEIKEMLGHETIQTSERYLYIHTELMREVLFNETL